MNGYIVFHPDGVKMFAYCIAPALEVEGRNCYRAPAVELVTDSTVETWPLYVDPDDDSDNYGRFSPIRDGLVPDREAAIRRAREAIEEWRERTGPDRGYPPDLDDPTGTSQTPANTLRGTRL